MKESVAFVKVKLCLHRNSFISKEQWKRCFQVAFKATQADRAMSTGDIHSCRISVNSERAECSRDGKRSSFGSQIKAWKWRASWLSCKYSRPSTDQEKSLASISHSFPFYLSLSFFFFPDIWLEMYSWISPAKWKRKRMREKVQDKDNPTA